MYVNKHNAVLITNTTLVEAARLLSGFRPESRRFRRLMPDRASEAAILTRRLIEFCNLAECIVLNEKVFSLPSKMPADAVGSPLIAGLTAAGIHQTLVSDEFATHAVLFARKILGRIGNDRVYGEAIDPRYLNVNGSHLSDDYFDFDPEDDIGTNFKLLLRSIEYDPKLEKLNLGDEAFFTRPVVTGKPKNLAEYIDAFHKDLHWNVSPNTDYVVHQIRNVVYWSSAEHFSLSYSPDVFRVDWVRSWLSRWKSSLSEHLYAVVANAFRSQANEVRREEDGPGILLPPIPALIAERSKTQDDVVKVLFDLRREFEGFRQNVRVLEEERRRARSIADRRTVMERIQSLFASVAKLSGRPQSARLSTAFGYTGKLLDVVKDPLNPKAYLSLAEKGADWVQDWWNARPAFRLLFLKRRLEHLPDYWKLSKIITGVELSEESVKTFESYYSKMENFGGDGFGRGTVSK